MNDSKDHKAAAEPPLNCHVMPRPCPFCGCQMRIRSNRDWHHLEGDHDGHCVFSEDDPTMSVPATPEQLPWMLNDWNRRHNASNEPTPLCGGRLD